MGLNSYTQISHRLLLPHLSHLLGHGIDATVQNMCGSTPLHVASSEGHVQVVCILLYHGVDAVRHTCAIALECAFPTDSDMPNMPNMPNATGQHMHALTIQGKVAVSPFPATCHFPSPFLSPSAPCLPPCLRINASPIIVKTRHVSHQAIKPGSPKFNGRCTALCRLQPYKACAAHSLH